ncbi:hypothetical protein [uncultured Dubosiella sp.]|nr:hypothetical protein [uncultured Dubosiella sp.]
MRRLLTMLLAINFVAGPILKPCEVHHVNDLCWIGKSAINPNGVGLGEE